MTQTKYKKHLGNEGYLLKLKYLENTSSGLGAPIWHSVGLDTANVVYGIRCNQCRQIYIGETKNTLGERLKQHLYHMAKRDKTTVLYTHFQEHTVDKVTTFGLETNTNWSRVQRQRAERRWIKTINTIDPMGLNEKY